ncbi:MAG: homoprotocatechuate degradation operon regulator HpaR [Marinovum algicola]|nr:MULTISPECIES: homoprotocatechuate degradation operon regulator HpaR [Marinovum]MDD9739783.1 homoprotocatechuate degradation operon regulator HpaR [Marinovum sp. SP66]MDD9744564.1 homoprotocatechuate degradation operon regulator HpaR [Marinovum sp. PR37]
MTQDAADFPPVDLPPTDQSLPIALLRARERLMIPIREALQVTGLTEQQWRLLRVLEEFGPQDATKLAERASLLMPSQTRIVQNLSEKGYVTRRTNPEDRRRQVVSITAAGHQVLVKNAPKAREISDEVAAALGEEKVKMLVSILDDIIHM